MGWGKGVGVGAGGGGGCVCVHGITGVKILHCSHVMTSSYKTKSTSNGS